MPIRKLPNSSSEIKQNKRSDSTGHSEIPTQRNIKYQIYAHIISRFSMSGAHAHWVRSLDTPSHARPTEGKRCANGTGSLITLNCGKGVNHGVTCTSIFLVLRSCTVENQSAVLSPRTPKRRGAW